MGIVNGVAQEVGCFFDGRMEHRTLEQSPGKDAGKEVACSAGTEGQAEDRVFVEGGRRRIIADDFAGVHIAGDTGNDDFFRSHVG